MICEITSFICELNNRPTRGRNGGRDIPEVVVDEFNCPVKISRACLVFRNWYELQSPILKTAVQEAMVGVLVAGTMVSVDGSLSYC